MATPAITWQVTITTGSNDAIDFKEDAGGEQNATLDAGSYDVLGADTLAGSLAKEIKTQLEATGAGTYAVSVSSAGLMSITVSGAVSAVQITWANGTNAATSARYVTGYGAADTASAATVTASSQVHGLFLFADGGPDLQLDTEDRGRIASPQSVAMSGKVVERPIGSVHYERRIEIGFIPRAKMFASTNNDKSIESMWTYLRGGNTRRIKYYPDPAAQTASDYTEYHLAPQSDASDTLDGWDRHSPAIELWSGEMMLRKYVA